MRPFRGLPGSQLRGTGGTRTLVRIGLRDRGHPPLMIVGPGAGWVISGFGYPPIYLFAGCSVVTALVLTRWLAGRARA